jgi:cell division protein FtsI (penicillin-binding protein 3)
VTAAPFNDGAEGLWRSGRGAGAWLWWLDRAFERARASGRAEDDTRLRIFFVMALFAAAFLTLGLVASKAALFSGLDAGAAGAGLTPEARADLVDRNGEVLAVDLVHYGLYITPREVSDPAATKAALLAALPTLSLAHLDTALTGPHKEYYVAGGIDPEVKDAIHDLALPGITFAEESARTYPLGETAVHVIGFAGKDGRGLAGAEKAFDAEIRGQAGKEPVALSIDLRVQGALQDELDAAADHFGVKDAVGMVVNVRTGEILGMASWPHFDPNKPGKADPAAMVNHAAATVYEP